MIPISEKQLSRPYFRDRQVYIVLNQYNLCRDRMISISKEELQELYWNKKLSIKKIATAFGCSVDCIHSKMIKFGIKRRSLSEAGTGRIHDVITKQKIAQSHKGIPRSDETKKKLSMWRTGKKMSEEFRKQCSERFKGRVAWNKGKPGLKGKDHPMYGKNHTEETKKRMSKARINYKPTEETLKKMSEALKGDKNPMYGRHGERSPNWKGGISFIPYCPKFNRVLKERIRERDNRICQVCGEKENDEKLSVHHIHYDKENCYPDLIGLCRRCNSKANKDRDYHEKLFMNKLNNRGLLFWIRDAAGIL